MTNDASELLVILEDHECRLVIIPIVCMGFSFFYCPTSLSLNKYREYTSSGGTVIIVNASSYAS